jgi:hypothetical protein
MHHNTDKVTHHQIVAMIVCPVLLPAAQDGDIEAPLDVLLLAAKPFGGIFDHVTVLYKLSFL